ncbi:MAG: succinic semialdehyde dehydrogenase [Candidatus Bipolaricaulota bacterium]|nr:succinic semialdehyde dehydrogenase [Candidatus Bipolaricaulota bacterium]
MGISISTQRHLEVFNPATGAKIADVPITPPEAVGEAVSRARQAFQLWRQFSVAQRARYLYAARDWIVDHHDDVIETICSETGKPRTEALVAEVFYCCDLLGYYAKNAERYLKDEIRSPHLLKTKRVFVIYQPLGVVGVISPWNFPFTLTLGDVVPALIAGNTVILKPSEYTPLTGLLVERVFREVGLPENVLQTLCGYGDTGAALVDHCDGIAFTGSVATGKKVAERAAQRLIPVLLELGGKDPMIVLKDADLERAANACVWGALSNAGQMCMSVERVYVEAPVYDEFVSRVVEKVKNLRQGAEKRFGEVDIGPLTMPKQLETVERHIRDAVEKGAKILLGGRRKDGLFYEPTVLVNVDHSMQIMREETFGPVIPLMKVNSAEEALQLANDSIYGLAASVFTKDKSLGVKLARHIEAGNVCVNDCITNFAILEAPYGGAKQSGLGRRHGEWGLRQFTWPQTVVVDRFGLKRELFWYPYSERVARWVAKAIRLLYRRGLREKFSSRR